MKLEALIESARLAALAVDAELLRTFPRGTKVQLMHNVTATVTGIASGRTGCLRVRLHNPPPGKNMYCIVHVSQVMA